MAHYGVFFCLVIFGESAKREDAALAALATCFLGHLIALCAQRIVSSFYKTQLALTWLSPIAAAALQAHIEETFTPLVLKCKQLGRAMRIGTNHGSLSARILSYYGDTPRGERLGTLGQRTVPTVATQPTAHSVTRQMRDCWLFGSSDVDGCCTRVSCLLAFCFAD